MRQLKPYYCSVNFVLWGSLTRKIHQLAVHYGCIPHFVIGTSECGSTLNLLVLAKKVLNRRTLPNWGSGRLSISVRGDIRPALSQRPNCLETVNRDYLNTPNTTFELLTMSLRAKCGMHPFTTADARTRLKRLTRKNKVDPTLQAVPQGMVCEPRLQRSPHPACRQRRRRESGLGKVSLTHGRPSTRAS